MGLREILENWVEILAIYKLIKSTYNYRYICNKTSQYIQVEKIDSTLKCLKISSFIKSKLYIKLEYFYVGIFGQ